MTMFLAIDVGTTTIKYVVYNQQQSLFSHSRRVDTVVSGKKVTQSPYLILEGIKKDIRLITEHYPNIHRLGLSTAMHSLIPIENKLEDELTMYPWSDNQAIHVIDEFKENSGLADSFYQATGTPIHPMSPFSKLLFFKREEPVWYHRVQKWYDIKSYLIGELTGEAYLDESLASATGLFNSHRMDWDESILSYLELDREQLPHVVPSTMSVPIRESVCEALHLPNHATIMVGGSDGGLAGIAGKASLGSDLTVTLGTSGAVRWISPTRYCDRTSQNFCYYLGPNQWLIGGPSNNGGRVLEWLSDLLYQDKTELFDHLDDVQQSEKLIFLPYLLGERAPFWDSHKTGSFHGLTLEHGKGDMTQAVIEGIIFNLLYIAECLSITSTTSNMVLSGGVFKNKRIAEMTATIFNQPCLVSKEAEPTRGLLFIENGELSTNISSQYYEPNKQDRMYYEEKYAWFKECIKRNMM